MKPRASASSRIIRPSVGAVEGVGAEPDERLMERVARGEIRALDVLFERFRDRLFGFLVRRCGDGSVAEDLLQETWLRVVRSRDRYDPRRRFSTWLFQIANNLCRDRARRREVERRGTRNARAMQESTPPRPGPELRIDMDGRLALLPDRLREVLILRYYHELSEREIAEIAEIPRGTVKSRLHHAIRELRKQDGDDV